jgi:hypothetical protein
MDKLFDGMPEDVKRLHAESKKMKRQERRQEWKEQALKTKFKPATDMTTNRPMPDR